jgi:hypothetical protein
MRFIGPRGLAFSLSLGVLSGLAPVGRVAHAADTQAEQLYRAGQKAVAAQDWAGACTDFRASEAREHAPGTVLNLAVCEEKLGQLVQAKAHFEIAAKEFRRRDPRIGYATRLAAAIDLRIPRLTMHLAPTLPPDATLERDGAPVDLSPLRQAGAAGQTVALDPGVHVLVVRAAGHADAHLDVKLPEAAREEITLAAGPLTDTGAAAALAPAPPPSSALAPVAPSAFTTTSPAGGAAAGAPSADGGSSLRGLGIAATAVGGAGLAFGFIAGAITLSKKSSADSNCSSTTCNAAGAAAESSGQTWSAVSTAGVVAGAAILATGITLIIVSPRDGDRSAGAAVGASGVHGVRLTRVGLAPNLGGPGGSGSGSGASLGLAGTF